MSATIKEKVEALLASQGWTVRKHLASCTDWQFGTGTHLYIGVNGSVRTGNTRSTSRPIAELIKRDWVARGEAMLVARKKIGDL